MAHMLSTNITNAGEPTPSNVQHQGHIDLVATNQDNSADSQLIITMNTIRHCNYKNNNPDRRQFCKIMKSKYNASVGKAIKAYQSFIDITQYFKNQNPNPMRFYMYIQNKYNISYGTAIKAYQYLAFIHKPPSSQYTSISNIAEVPEYIDAYGQTEGELVESSPLKMISHVIPHCKNNNPDKTEFCAVMEYRFNAPYRRADELYREYIDIRHYVQNIRPNRKEFCQRMKQKYHVSYGEAIKSFQDLFVVYKEMEGETYDHETNYI